MDAQGLEHEALFYADEESFLAGTLPFIREAVAAGEPIMVAVDREKIDLLRSHLNGEGELVLFTDMRELGRNPALIIPAWREFVGASTGDGRTCRGIGEPIWPGRSDAELVECQHHESLLNLAFERGPAWRLLCPYDTSALSRDVLAGAEHNHPRIEEEDVKRESGSYRDPAVTGAPFTGRLPEPGAETAEVRFESPADLDGTRRFVAEHAAAARLDREIANGLVLAVDEVVTNALLYGGRGGRVRAWTEADSVICEVEGGGTISDPLVGRVLPEPARFDGRGLWIANHFCDLVQIRSGSEGTVVRCHAGPNAVPAYS